MTLPHQISSWDNFDHGDCVTAEEAFAKACHQPEIFITDQIAMAWAKKHDVLEGANLHQVLLWMQSNGFQENGHTFDDGQVFSVDWTDPSTLESAISNGPVKIGVGQPNSKPHGGRPTARPDGSAWDSRRTPPKTIASASAVTARSPGRQRWLKGTASQLKEK